MTVATAAELNIEHTRLAHKRFSAGDVDGVLELCEPDLEFKTFVAEMEGRVYRGADGVREWMENVHETFDGFSNEPLAIEALGDDGVLAEVLVGGAAGGLRLEQRVFQLIEMRDGRAYRWSWHRTREEALAARGKPL